MNTLDNPLVSIVVITYNSSKYILETLESAKNQTYSNVELIISDDHSTDNTIEIVGEYIEKYSSFFVRCELIQSESNTGISENCNRGINIAKGKWIKLIAGDDILSINCLFDFVNYSINNPQAKFIFSSQISFFNENLIENYESIKNYCTSFIFKDVCNARQQFLFLLFNFPINSPTLFFERESLINVNGFDNDAKAIDDVILIYRILLKGEKLYYLNKITVLYRKHLSSITHNDKYAVKRNLERSYRREKYIMPNVNYFTLKIYSVFYYLYFSKTKNSRKIAVLIQPIINQMIIKKIIIK
jgi:glycosyltransferase involved in cell wall biosynthesis